MSTDHPVRLVGLIVGALTVGGFLVGGITSYNGKANAADVQALDHRQTIVETKIPEMKQDILEIKSMLQQILWNGCLPASPAHK
jgi:hypothetical protein